MKVLSLVSGTPGQASFHAAIAIHVVYVKIKNKIKK